MNNLMIKKTMKRFIYITLSVLGFISCTEKPEDIIPDTPSVPKTIAGEWHYESASIETEIYLGFTDEGKFELYQKIGDGKYRLYRGSWNLENDILSGKYNDGKPWGSDYAFSLSESGDTMTLSPLSSAGGEGHLYTRTDIPSEVKDGCVSVVKSY